MGKLGWFMSLTYTVTSPPCEGEPSGTIGEGSKKNENALGLQPSTEQDLPMREKIWNSHANSKCLLLSVTKSLKVELAPLEVIINLGQFLRLCCASIMSHFDFVSKFTALLICRQNQQTRLRSWTMICTSLGGLPHLMLYVYDCIYTEVLKSVDWEFVLILC